jgi:hypothetical protein
MGRGGIGVERQFPGVFSVFDSGRGKRVIKDVCFNNRACRQKSF